MNWKEFLKPELKRLAISILLIVISSFLSFTPQNVVVVSYGFPLSVYSNCRPVLGCPIGLNYGIDYFGAIVNVIFWYFISCLTVWIYNKMKKK